MNTDPLTDILLAVSHHAGVSPVAAAWGIPMLIIFASRGARLIPDTAKGPLGWLRVACKIIGLSVKDNSGVPALQNDDGTVTRQAQESQLPGGESVEEPAAMNPVDRINVFKQGADALAKKEF